VRSTAVSPIVKQIFFILGAKVRRIFVNSKYSSSNASRFAEEICRFAEIVRIVVKLFLSLHRQINDFGQEISNINTDIKLDFKMKKIVLTMVALLSMTVMQAQNNDKCECKKGAKKEMRKMTPEMMTEKMTKELSLTDAQKTKVLALNKEYQDVLKGPKMGGPRPQKPQADAETGATEQRPERPQLTDAQKAEMKQMKAKRDEYNKKLKSILNDEQYKKYEKMQKRHGRHGGRHGHGGPRGPRPDMEPMD
jgi:hypothetical protein